MTLSVPGKVFVMGEYSVIDRRSKALIAPTEKRLFVTIERSKTYTYKSELDGTFTHSSLNEFIRLNPSKILQSVVPYIHPLDAQNRLEVPFSVSVDSQLDAASVPYGLGSSGAFRVGLIKAFLAYLKHPIDALTLFHLAALSSQKDASSYGDLAVASYDRAILYQKPSSLSPLEGLHIEPVSLPPFCIVHTGKKVSSTPFIQRYLALQDKTDVEDYAAVINTLLMDFQDSPIEAQLDRIQWAQRAYQILASKVHPDIIPAFYKPIIDAIEATGGVVKISGAGGGDNLLAFYPDVAHLKKASTLLSGTYQIFFPAR